MLDTLTVNELYRLKLKLKLTKLSNQSRYEFIYKVIDHNIILKLIERSKAHGTI